MITCNTAHLVKNMFENKTPSVCYGQHALLILIRSHVFGTHANAALHVSVDLFGTLTYQFFKRQFQGDKHVSPTSSHAWKTGIQEPY